MAGVSDMDKLVIKSWDGITAQGLPEEMPQYGWRSPSEVVVITEENAVEFGWYPASLWPDLLAAHVAAEVERKKQAAYQAEADPLYFKAMRGEGSLADWLAKVAEIRGRFNDGAA